MKKLGPMSTRFPGVDTADAEVELEEEPSGLTSKDLVWIEEHHPEWLDKIDTARIKRRRSKVHLGGRHR